ncbi:MAG: hypothetical protein U0166_02750 [Acidobacteriota bacterium]
MNARDGSLRYEVWLDVAWMRLSDGAPYVEYGDLMRCKRREEAEAIARRQSREGAVLILDTETGEVWEPERSTLSRSVA